MRRLVNPGTALGSITTSGIRAVNAAITGGPATYPPMLKTAAVRLRRIRPTMRIVLMGNCPRVASLRSAPTRFNPPMRINSKEKPAAGTRRASTPRSVPTKNG